MIDKFKPIDNGRNRPGYGHTKLTPEALGLSGRPNNRVHSMGPGQDRSKERSRFFPSIARAMAEQWGGFANSSLFRLQSRGATIST